MRYLRILALVGLVAIVPACATDGMIGVSQDPVTGKVTIDPNGGKLGSVITGGQAVAPFLPPPLSGFLLLGLGVASAGLHVWQQIRASNWKGAALATASGVQDAIGKLDAAHAQTPIAPSAAADLVKAAVDAAHDAHGVTQAVQNILTPVT
jgi:hypothetical protein